MMRLKTRLRNDAIRRDVAEFVCLLIDMLEFEHRLELPIVRSNRSGGVELVWRHQHHTLRLFIHTPGSYRYSAVVDEYGEVLNGEVGNRATVQQLRNLLLWLWNDTW